MQVFESWIRQSEKEKLVKHVPSISTLSSLMLNDYRFECFFLEWFAFRYRKFLISVRLHPHSNRQKARKHDRSTLIGHLLPMQLS